MSRAPAFQFYPGDFLTGTALMSNAEVGLYIRLLCLQAEHGSVPDDVERIVQAYGRTARALWTAVRKKFQPGTEEGTLVNVRMVEVLGQRDAFRLRQSEKGKASAQSRTNSKRTPDQPRRSRGSTPVEPLGVGDEVGDRVEVGKEEEVGQGKKERAGAKRKGPDPDVQGVIDYLTKRLQDEGIAKSLDGPAENNRWAARSLIQKLGKEEPDFPPLESAKALVDAALQDAFHRKNATTVRYLLNNCGKISANFKANGTRTAKGSSVTPDQATRATAEYFANKRAGAGSDG